MGNRWRGRTGNNATTAASGPITDLYTGQGEQPVPIPACFHLAESVFPRVRAVVAAHLAADGWSQSRTAEALGISQAMVSKYLARLATEPETDPLVLRLAGDVRRELETPTPPATGSVSSWCQVLGSGEDGTAREALQDLLAAEKTLVEAAPLEIMPQVGLNIVRAVGDARDPAHVYGFPGRIVEAGQTLISPAPPSLGASGHLARCLIALRERSPEVVAMANIRGGPVVAEAARRAGYEVAQIDRTSGGTTDDEAPFQAAVQAAPESCSILHDPGAFGVEPCLYIAGPSAHEAVDRILHIREALVNP